MSQWHIVNIDEQAYIAPEKLTVVEKVFSVVVFGGFYATLIGFIIGVIS